MTKKQLDGLKSLIESLNALRSNFAGAQFVVVECILDDGLFNKLVVECPFASNAWELSLMVDRNSTVHCAVSGSVVTFE